MCWSVPVKTTLFPEAVKIPPKLFNRWNNLASRYLNEIHHQMSELFESGKTGIIFDKNKVLTFIKYLNRFKDGVQVRISSGMTAQVDIKIGTRRLISYFFSPIIRGLKESFKER